MGSIPSAIPKLPPPFHQRFFLHKKSIYLDILSLPFVFAIQQYHLVHYGSLALMFVIFLKTPSLFILTTSYYIHCYSMFYTTIVTQDGSQSLHFISYTAHLSRWSVHCLRRKSNAVLHPCSQPWKFAFEQPTGEIPHCSSM